MREEWVKRHNNILNEIAEWIEKDVSYIEVTGYEDRYDDANEEVIRTLNLNRGNRNYMISINWYGLIHEYSNKIPRHMLIDIHNSICGTYLKEILLEARGEAAQ